ncbi:unnamed protein product [Caenorhabditis bovis]|uniref:C2H2-type domain-containing protein n=1 Tax=Caenorhabditis bovis TaxID=2654633 RepID=A0A8S1F9Q4_9PELO|nr:unnamed protein product [Caenorhabditis bovis]
MDANYRFRNKECSRDLLEDLYECGGIGDDDIIGIDWLNNGSWTTYKLSSLEYSEYFRKTENLQLHQKNLERAKIPAKLRMLNLSQSTIRSGLDFPPTDFISGLLEIINILPQPKEDRIETLSAEKNDPRLPLIDSCSPELAVPGSVEIINILPQIPPPKEDRDEALAVPHDSENGLLEIINILSRVPRPKEDCDETLAVPHDSENEKPETSTLTEMPQIQVIKEDVDILEMSNSKENNEREDRIETLSAEKNDPRLPLIDSCSPELAVPENMRKRLIDELEFFWNSVDATTWKKHGVSIYKINEKATCKPCGLRPNCFSDAVSLGTHIFARKHKNYIIKYGFSISDYAIWKEALLHCIGKKAKNKNIYIEKTSKTETEKKESKEENGSKYPLFNSFGSTNKLPKAEFIEEYDKLCEQINGIPAKIIVKMRVQKLDLTCDFCKCQIQSFSSLASHVFSKGHSKKIKEKCEGTKEDLEYWKTFIKEAQAATDIAFGNAKEEIPLFNFFGNGEKDLEFEKEYDALAKRFSNIPIECVAIVNTSKNKYRCRLCAIDVDDNHTLVHFFQESHENALRALPQEKCRFTNADMKFWEEKLNALVEHDFNNAPPLTYRRNSLEGNLIGDEFSRRMNALVNDFKHVILPIESKLKNLAKFGAKPEDFEYWEAIIHKKLEEQRVFQTQQNSPPIPLLDVLNEGDKRLEESDIDEKINELRELIKKMKRFGIAAEHIAYWNQRLNDAIKRMENILYPLEFYYANIDLEEFKKKAMSREDVEKNFDELRKMSEGIDRNLFNSTYPDLPKRNNRRSCIWCDQYLKEPYDCLTHMFLDRHIHVMMEKCYVTKKMFDEWRKRIENVKQIAMKNEVEIEKKRTQSMNEMKKLEEETGQQRRQWISFSPDLKYATIYTENVHATRGPWPSILGTIENCVQLERKVDKSILFNKKLCSICNVWVLDRATNIAKHAVSVTHLFNGGCAICDKWLHSVDEIATHVMSADHLNIEIVGLPYKVL